MLIQIPLRSSLTVSIDHSCLGKSPLAFAYSHSCFFSFLEPKCGHQGSSPLPSPTTWAHPCLVQISLPLIYKFTTTTRVRETNATILHFDRVPYTLCITDFDSGKIDSSGVRFYVSDQLREQELGMLQIGGEPFSLALFKLLFSKL